MTTTTISNTDDTINSRDIIERIEELTEQCEDSYLDYDEYEELCILSDLAEECERYSSDWNYGETLIRYDYFETYQDDLIEECYDLPKDLPFWMKITYDYDALKQDYTLVDFEGVDYYIRSV